MAADRTADHWWAWAEQDDDRLTRVLPCDDAAAMMLRLACADAADASRCRRWVAGESDDGPDREWLADAESCAARDAEDDARERAAEDQRGRERGW